MTKFNETHEHERHVKTADVDHATAVPFGDLATECFFDGAKGSIFIIANCIGANICAEDSDLHHNFDWEDMHSADGKHHAWGFLTLCNGKSCWTLYVIVDSVDGYTFRGDQVSFENLQINAVGPEVLSALAFDASVALRAP